MVCGRGMHETPAHLLAHGNKQKGSKTGPIRGRHRPVVRTPTTVTDAGLPGGVAATRLESLPFPPTVRGGEGKTETANANEHARANLRARHPALAAPLGRPPVLERQATLR